MFSVTFLFYFLLFQFTFQEELYDFEPESRHYDVNQGETVLVSFNEVNNQTNFTHCYIESQGIKVDYTIIKYVPNDTETWNIGINDDRFFYYNNTRICGFYYDDIDSDSPLSWNITAYDSFRNKTFSEIVNITLYYNLPLYLSKLVAYPSASIMSFFQTDTSFVKCTLQFDDFTIELDLNTIKTYNNNSFKSGVMSIGDGKCGYKINNLAKKDSKNLTLYAVDKDSKTYRNTTLLVVVSDASLINRTLEVYLGASATIHCGAEDTYHEQKFCYLYNPRGELVTHEKLCSYSLPMVTLDDLGIWRCSVGNTYVMKALEFQTELIRKIIESVTVFTSNTTNYLIIGCQLKNYEDNVASYCRFTRPDGKIFIVKDGETSDFYNTVSTDLKNGKCSIEILKPLRSADRGNWRCEAVISQDKISGGFIPVSATSSYSLKIDETLRKHVHLGQPFEVECLMPYSSDSCFIMAPNGSQFLPANPYEPLVGSCSFKIDHATYSDNGIWKCSIARRDGVPDEIIRVEISVIEYNVIFHNYEVSEGDEVTLVCNSGGTPISYCRFVAPTGLSYSLKKEATGSNKISYVGRGLEYGDCGLKIARVESEQGGEWSCHLSPGTQYQPNRSDLSKRFQLKLTPPRSSISVAGSLGLGLGIVAVVIIVAGFIFYKYLRPSRRHQDIDLPPVQRTSDSSGESVILSLSQNVFYNTQ